MCFSMKIYENIEDTNVVKIKIKIINKMVINLNRKFYFFKYIYITLFFNKRNKKCLRDIIKKNKRYIY